MLIARQPIAVLTSHNTPGLGPLAGELKQPAERHKRGEIEGNGCDASHCASQVAIFTDLKWFKRTAWRPAALDEPVWSIVAGVSGCSTKALKARTDACSVDTHDANLVLAICEFSDFG